MAQQEELLLLDLLFLLQAAQDLVQIALKKRVEWDQVALLTSKEETLKETILEAAV